MKWKTILLFFFAALLIAASFIVPPMLLRCSISQSVDKPALTDASAPDVKSAESFAEKLASFSDPESSSVSLDLEEDTGMLLSRLHEELRVLCDVGAIPREVYNSLDTAVEEGFDAVLHCVIQPGRHLMFFVYSIQIRSIDAELLLDWPSEKILGMSYSLFDDGMLILECDEAQADRELQGWADYLDMNPGRTVRTGLNMDEITEPGENSDPIMLKQAVLEDGTGTGILFGQTFAYRRGAEKYTWGPIY